jgi:lipid-A-disaccharide synthase
MSNQSKKKIFIVAGEASGDLHGANLVHAIKAMNPEIEFYGMGGRQLNAAGVNLFIDSTDFSAIGFIEIVSKLQQNYQALKKISKYLKQHKPDLLVLIDYPTFNLRLAKIAKKINIKIVYYISPQLWAWRQSRINIIKKNIDLMAVVFPFEVEFYQHAQVPVKFVGHPLANHVHPTLSPHKARQFFGISEQTIVIGLMPGSRHSEIKHILPTLLQAAQRLQNHYQTIEFLLPLASTLHQQDLEPYLAGLALNLKIITDKTYDAIQICEAVIVASGTATLEITLLKIPMVIVYKGLKSSYLIAKKLVKIPYIGLCNIMANEKIVQEFIQDQATPTNIAQEIIHIVDNNEYRAQIRNRLGQIARQLCDEKNACSLAQRITQMIGE